MDSNYGDIKLTKGLVEIETLQWFVKLDWNSALETSQLFMMKMRGNPVLLVSHLVPYLKRWNLWKSTRISLLTNFFMVLKMMQFSNRLLKCLIHFTIFFGCRFFGSFRATMTWMDPWQDEEAAQKVTLYRDSASWCPYCHKANSAKRSKDQLLILDSV